MKLHVFFLAVLTLTGAGALMAQTVTFTAIPHKSGEVFQEESGMELTMVLHADVEGQQMDFDVSNKDSYTRSVSIMEMFGNDISQFKVSYSEFTNVAKSPQGETVTNGPVIGRTYKIFRTDTVKSVESEDRKPMTGEEEGYLRTEFKKSDFSERMNKILDGKTMQAGDSVALSKDLAMSFFGKNNENDVKEFTIKFASTKEVAGMNCALFSARIVLEGENNGMSMQFVMNGEMTVGISNCWPLELHLAGPVVIQGQPQGVAITGEGTMTGVKKFKYGE